MTVLPDLTNADPLESGLVEEGETTKKLLARADRHACGWTGERILFLKRSWSAGRTPRQIAEELGVTRNAVIGKAHRLGLRWLPPNPKPRPRPRRKPIKAKPQHKWRNGHLVTAKPAPLPPVPAVNPPRPLFELGDGECRWVVDAGAALFCGAPVAEPRRPYCARHMLEAREH